MQSKIKMLALLASAAGVAQLAFALSRVRRFARSPRAQARNLPGVTILKPLYGLEEGLYENLCSFCGQDYPLFDVVFGVHDLSDPAADVARRVVARFPHARLIAGTGHERAANPKIANLAKMLDGGTHEVLVLADADMRVDPQYLRAIVAPFDDAEVGAVTCLYAVREPKGLASTLAAMYINEQFAPSVLVAGALEPLAYGFGATLAVRAATFNAVGGLGALERHVADDYELGRLVAQSGLRVVLSRYVVENVVAEPSLATMWSRELRWSRTIRSVRPLGHAFMFIGYGLPLAVLAAWVRRDRPGNILLLVAAGLRLALQRAANEAFGVTTPAPAAMIPLRDALSFAVWLASFLSRDVRWRDRTLALDPDGKIL